MKSINVLLAISLLLTSCATRKLALQPTPTWEHAWAIAVEKAKTHQYAYILDNMLAPEFKAQLIARHGEKNWKEKFTQEKLKHLPYFYSWLKNGKTTATLTRTTVQGQFGCYAGFVKINGHYFLADFGQNSSSM